MYFYESLVEYVSNKNSMLFVIEGNPDIVQLTRSQLRASLEPLLRKKAEFAFSKYIKSNSAASAAAVMAPIGQDVFITEYVLTFDVIHCSDAADGLKEIALFFDNKELGLQTVSTEQEIKILLELFEYKRTSQGDAFRYPSIIHR